MPSRDSMVIRTTQETLIPLFPKIRSIHIMMTVAGSNLKSHNYIELPPEKS